MAEQQVSLSRAQRKQHQPHDRRTLDPLISLQVPMDVHSNSKLPMGAGSSRSTITSLCFLHTATPTMATHNDCVHEEDDSDNGSSSSDEDEIEFQCQKLLRNDAATQRDPALEARQIFASTSLMGGRFIASAHANGETLLWDLVRRQVVDSHFLSSPTQKQQSATASRGPGLTIRRMSSQTTHDDTCTSDSQQQLLLYQTRDPLGIVSLHALDHHFAANNNNNAPMAPIVTTFETHSQTFCAAVPCHGNPNLLALPSVYDDEATIRDIRIDPSDSPVAVVSATVGSVDQQDNRNDQQAGRIGGNENSAIQRSHGMLTSLALAADHNHSGRLVLACGMESGVIFYHDVAMTQNNSRTTKFPANTIHSTNQIKVASDPILALDMAPSLNRKSSSPATETKTSSSSFVTIAGMAGDAVEVNKLPSSEQGTVAVIKATLLTSPDVIEHQNRHGVDVNIRLRLRSRLRTCRPTGGGKPGVNLCRFRPGDGRLFAVGGWDKRLRIYDRALTTQQPLPRELVSSQGQEALVAILRGHTDSIAAMDWAPDAEDSGLLATGAADGRINIWRCFSKVG